MSLTTPQKLSPKVQPGSVSAVSNLASHGASPTSGMSIKEEPSSPESSLSESRTRKTGRSITSNACTNCKKARSKCDGGQPSCHRCRARPITQPCEYVLHTKALKEQLLREVQQLQAQNRSLTQRNTFLGDKNDAMEEMLQCLKDDEQIGAFVGHLLCADNRRPVSDWATQGPVLFFGAPPATSQQPNGAIQNLHERWDLSSEMLSWMELNLQNPRYQMGADIE